MKSPRFAADYTQEIMNMEYPLCGMTEVTAAAKRKKNKNKRRFSDDQIRSLESIFESESRLDPRKKYQVAKDLGLQPRQVAIWFQNKRARRKSKELERDYAILQDNYNNLASKFEGLKNEKQVLQSQLQKLNDLLKKPKEEEHCCGQVDDKLSVSMERSDHAFGVLSDDDSGLMTGCFRLEQEPERISLVEPADGPLTSPEDWHGFESDALFDQSGSGHQWWDFWS